jgi:signal transduction histidine kinase
VHRRLRDLEAAAAAVGAGETAVRAPEGGGDEVASLARRFNRMAADLDARVRDLREADRSRRQLLADVSHELMTPLTAMRGYLETLALPAAVKDDATRARYLGIVTEETLRLEAIIGDLLDLARLEGGGGTLEREPVPVARLFERAAARHEVALEDAGVTLEQSIAPGVPPIAGDARRLEQALQNLVANAVRHTPRGGRVTLRAEPAGAGVRLVVEDTGSGIPAEHLPHVFDRFYRVDAARDAQSGGSGLGLSIVRAVVERHGGRVSAANTPGGGARFAIDLPGGDAAGVGGGGVSDSGTRA